MIKHFLTVYSPWAKSSSNLCCHKLIRSAEIWKQRTVSSTRVCNPPTQHAAAQVKYQTHTFHLSPSSSASNGLLAYLAQHLKYSWSWRVRPGRAQRSKGGRLVEVHYLLMNWQTSVHSDSTQKSSRGVHRRHPPHTPIHRHSPPSPPAFHRSAYVVTNDTFIFLQRLCVCKTAEVHQDVKYFGWATQVALEDNQMEV